MSRNARKYRRLNAPQDIQWKLGDQKLSGTTKLVDVSLLGASFQVDQPFTVQRAVTFDLESSELPSLPKQAKLRWYRKAGNDYPPKFLVGVVFQGSVSAEWTSWIAELEHKEEQAEEQQEKELVAVRA